MMGFTLSKMHMLILVTALFVIIAYFMQSLTGIVVGNEAQQLVSSYGEKINSIIISESLCFKSSITVPEFITYFGGATQAEKLFNYVMKISRIKGQGEQGISSLILAISNRQFPDKFIAAQRVDVRAEMKIYNWDTGTDTIVESPEGFTFIDPQAFPPVNSFFIIKEVFRDQAYLYIIPCATQGRIAATGQGSCSNNITRVGCLIKEERGVESACVPKADYC